MTRSMAGRLILGILVMVLFSLIGCNFLSGNGPMGSEVTGISQEGPGNLEFRMVLPQPSSSPLAGIRAATGSGSCTVTFRIILGNLGNNSNLTQAMSKTVTVNSDGSANATFHGLPLKPVVALLGINGGHYGGFTDFHGAAELNPGENSMDVVPTGCGLPADILANSLQSVFQSPELMVNSLPGMVNILRTLIQPSFDSQGKLPSGVDPTTLSTKTLDGFARRTMPTTAPHLEIASDGTALLALQNQAESWRRSPAQVLVFSGSGVTDASS